MSANAVYEVVIALDGIEKEHADLIMVNSSTRGIAATPLLSGTTSKTASQSAKPT